ncbi:zinc finger protein CONSTANS-LIKE 5-like [Amborella trichopoda]|uniref:zinc finger protein CONSTANS-LIKE 5-like n=1 Tax=Amborella trichopoda TaxID=13333 RepID=UPI0009C1354C|nr:zinc finger protein CONSTANS-LIKE 5-like [Amborella trichopoda]|eukprot:XP_020528494.1 zinc finger protein CONSTANS-LIKE 5-like [Amborella trichopoda]
MEVYSQTPFPNSMQETINSQKFPFTEFSSSSFISDYHNFPVNFQPFYGAGIWNSDHVPAPQMPEAVSGDSELMIGPESEALPLVFCPPFSDQFNGFEEGFGNSKVSLFMPENGLPENGIEMNRNFAEISESSCGFRQWETANAFGEMDRGRKVGVGDLQDFSGTSTEESGLKVGRYSVEEKRERIHRYLKKRSHRNFTKTIKYACRKTLADSRPRVRGRFAKNDDFPTYHTKNTENQEDGLVAIAREDEKKEGLLYGPESLMYLPFYA